MTHPSERIVSLYQQKLYLLKECLQLMEGKTLIMMSNSLLQLEQSLEREALVVFALSELNGSIQTRLEQSPSAVPGGRRERVRGPLNDMSSEEIFQLRKLESEIDKTVRDIRRVKQKNAALIESGLQFSSVLLGAICPPQTYHPAGGATVIPGNSLLSVNY